jgi:hypothetical protein
MAGFSLVGLDFSWAGYLYFFPKHEIYSGRKSAKKIHLWMHEFTEKKTGGHARPKKNARAP